MIDPLTMLIPNTPLFAPVQLISHLLTSNDPFALTHHTDVWLGIRLTFVVGLLWLFASDYPQYH